MTEQRDSGTVRPLRETPDSPLDDGTGQTHRTFNCPSCDAPVCEWCDCPECGWYSEAVWEATLND